MSTGTSLYYPFIHPRDENYLKSALMYWDRVRRIVPNSVMHGDHVVNDNYAGQLLTDKGLLVATRPEPYEEGASARFFQYLEPHVDRFRIDLQTATDLASRNGGFHIEKFGDAVAAKMMQLGLAHKLGDWLTMHDEVGAFYMLCLASEMSEKMASPLYTDSPADAHVGEALLFTPQPTDAVSDVLVRLGIPMPSPEQLNGISIDEIAEFAVKRQGEKQEFRVAVEGILATAGTYQDQNAMDDYLSSQRVRIETAVTNLYKTIDELGVGAVSGFAKITVPAGMAAGIAALPFSPIAAAILSGLGLVISGISCFAETRGKLRQARSSSPYHYLISIKDDLGLD